jgi:hypothetical protein
VTLTRRDLSIFGITVIVGIFGILLFIYHCLAVAKAAQEAEQRDLRQRETITRLINSDQRFSLCRVYHLDFVTRYGCPEGFCNWSETSETRPLLLLEKLNYAKVLEAPTHLVDDSPDVPTWWWTPSADIKPALGPDLTEERTTSFSLSGQRMGAEDLEELRLTGAYRWTLNLGCRHFNQVDAVTPLGDGFRVDFSWRYIPSRLGQAEGLSGSRQRGTA